MPQEQSILGKGWFFPIKPSINRRLVYFGGPEKIRQSIWLILSTAPGERQMRPEFGCGIHELVFQPNTAVLRTLVAVRVREALVRWEPRIDVLDVRVETPFQETQAVQDYRNYLLIRIDYRLRTNNTFYNLVYPFFINEGGR